MSVPETKMAMRNFQPRGTFDRSAAASLFRHTLSRISSLFGRLMYLSSLRDHNSGTYRHFGLATAFGQEQSSEAMETSHTRAFREWLRLPLRNKHEDLQAYLETLDDPKGLVVRYWLESQGYMGGIPDSASKADRQHYVEDVTQLLQVVTNAVVSNGVVRSSNGVASRAPKSSPQK